MNSFEEMPILYGCTKTKCGNTWSQSRRNENPKNKAQILPADQRGGIPFYEFTLDLRPASGWTRAFGCKACIIYKPQRDKTLSMNNQPESTNRSLDPRPIAAAAIAIGLVLSTAIAAHAWHDVRFRPKNHNIRITGSAKKRIVSDLIQWEAIIEARAADRAAAYRTLREGREKAVAFLTAQGIKADEIQPQSATSEEVFEKVIEDKLQPGTNVSVRTETKVSKGFRTSEAILVRSTDVARVEKASREITSLLEQGITVNSEAPDYFYTKLSDLKVEMLAAAAKDARTRAENILRSAGNASIGKLVVADMGIININPANITKTSEDGNNDTSSLEKDIITIVHAEFEVN